jgi:gp16 family phage-associated protein
MTASDGEEFSAWLNRRLAARGISQRQLARRAGVDHSTISRILNGSREPRRGTARRLEAAIGGAWSRRLAEVLRDDPVLAEGDVTRIVKLYLGLRAARMSGTGAGSPRREPPDKRGRPST